MQFLLLLRHGEAIHDGLEYWRSCPTALSSRNAGQFGRFMLTASVLCNLLPTDADGDRSKLFYEYS
jgi:hypothetical protein